LNGLDLIGFDSLPVDFVLANAPVNKLIPVTSLLYPL